MPTYTYKCTSCSQVFEELQWITDRLLVRCPHCQKDALVRLIGGGAGLVFKGSGFYLTDYKRKSEGPGAEGSTKKQEPLESKPPSPPHSESKTSPKTSD